MASQLEAHLNESAVEVAKQYKTPEGIAELKRQGLSDEEIEALQELADENAEKGIFHEEKEQFAEVLLTATLAKIGDNISSPFDILARTLGYIHDEFSREISELGAEERRKAEIEMLVHIMFTVVSVSLTNNVPYDVLDEYRERLCTVRQPLGQIWVSRS